MTASTASIRKRLLVSAAIFIAIAVIGATVIIGFVLHRFIQGQIDQRLDTQIVFLSSLITSDNSGLLSLTGDADGPPFDRPGRGWYWQVDGPKNTLSSKSLSGADINLPNAPPRDRRPPDKKKHDSKPRPADGAGPDGQRLHYRKLERSVDGTFVTLIASAPRDAVIGPLREALTTLVLSMMVLGAGLVLATLLQVRLGLRPLERLRSAVADIRSGRGDRLPTPQPPDIQPLVLELNELLDQNATNLDRARRHVANLAHGLKTPLATLSVALSERDSDPQGRLHRLVSVMERQIRHHLSRARTAALSGPVRAQTPVAPSLRDLAEALHKINAGKNIALSTNVPDDLVVACEQQDFNEMCGNILDNAFRYARGHIAIATRDAAGRTMWLDVDDDGPGLDAEYMTHALRAGERLDESSPGFGFGLAITRELAELYGGEMVLGASPLGGLRVSLQLPLAI